MPHKPKTVFLICSRPGHEVKNLCDLVKLCCGLESVQQPPAGVRSLGEYDIYGFKTHFQCREQVKDKWRDIPVELKRMQISPWFSCLLSWYWPVSCRNSWWHCLSCNMDIPFHLPAIVRKSLVVCHMKCHDGKPKDACYNISTWFIRLQAWLSMLRGEHWLAPPQQPILKSPFQNLLVVIFFGTGLLSNLAYVGHGEVHCLNPQTNRCFLM